MGGSNSAAAPRDRGGHDGYARDRAALRLSRGALVTQTDADDQDLTVGKRLSIQTASGDTRAEPRARVRARGSIAQVLEMADAPPAQL
jgi:hypothetical protein